MTAGAAERFARYQARVAAMVDERLRGLLSGPPELVEAMAYSLFGGGKRLRPVLCVAACEAARGTAEAALPAACALEMVHTYSLIHDDLPSMDDDAFRRGRPTSHVVFGEALALLAGDALLTLAFDVVARSGEAGGGDAADAARRSLAGVRELAEAAGAAGMVGGQVLDLELAGIIVPRNGSPAAAPRLTVETLLDVYQKKTGRLFVAGVRLGGIAAGAGPAALDALGRYGEAVGLAFQVADDLDDVERDRDRPGAASLPLVAGAAAARSRAAAECARGRAALGLFGPVAGPLEDFVTSLEVRLEGE